MNVERLGQAFARYVRSAKAANKLVLRITSENRTILYREGEKLDKIVDSALKDADTLELWKHAFPKFSKMPTQYAALCGEILTMRAEYKMCLRADVMEINTHYEESVSSILIHLFQLKIVLESIADYSLSTNPLPRIQTARLPILALMDRAKKMMEDFSTFLENLLFELSTFDMGGE